jgi:ATP-dependent exoDNAse (exonuclease V) beta subunit
MISGMIDQLFFNIKSGKLEIWDWKTNKQILFDNPYKMKFPVNHLSTAELHAYSLQLSCYRYLIEKNTTLELGDSYLAWFNEKNDTYKTYKCFDFRPEIESLIKHYMANK